MGHEYLIDYRPADMDAWSQFASRLENPGSPGDQSSFAVETRVDGIYFCDHGRTPAAAVALRRILDEAMQHGDSVTIREL